MWSGAGPGCAVTDPARPLPPALDESSGVAASLTHSGVYWTHSDDQGLGVIFAVDGTGKELARVQLDGVTIFDFEDIAAARCGDEFCLYLADTGDNYDERASLVVYRMVEPPTTSATVPVQHIPIKLPDGPRDVEAIFVLPGEQLFLVTKGHEQPIVVYRYPGALKPDTLVTVQEVQRLS